MLKDKVITMLFCIVLGIIGVISLYHISVAKTPEMQYKGVEDIVVNKKTITGIAVIEEVQTFTKENIPHVQFHANIIESDDYIGDSPFVGVDNMHIFTQEEYNRVFGEDNNAFDYEEYKLNYTVVVCQDDRLFGNSVKIFADKNNMDDGAGFYGPCFCVLECKEYFDLEEVESAYVRYDKKNTSLELCLNIQPRANFLGGTEYSQEDIESHKSMIDNMCQDVIRMVAGEKAKFTWIEK